MSEGAKASVRLQLKAEEFLVLLEVEATEEVDSNYVHDLQKEQVSLFVPKAESAWLLCGY